MLVRQKPWDDTDSLLHLGRSQCMHSKKEIVEIPTLTVKMRSWPNPQLRLRWDHAHQPWVGSKLCHFVFLSPSRPVFHLFSPPPPGGQGFSTTEYLGTQPRHPGPKKKKKKSLTTEQRVPCLEQPGDSMLLGTGYSILRIVVAVRTFFARRHTPDRRGFSFLTVHLPPPMESPWRK